MNNLKKIKNICYVLESFPNPSETFISDEAASMMDLGVTPFVLALGEGDSSVVHPIAKKLLDKGLLTVVKEVTKTQSLISIIKLLFKKPIQAISCIINLLSSEDRWIYFQAAPSALNLLEKKIDYIHAHFAASNFCWAEVLSKWTEIPFGVTTHGYDLFFDPIPLSKAVKVFAKANLIVTISEFNQKFMAQKYGIPIEKIKIIHCGVDLKLFNRLDNSDKLKDKKLKLINIGRLVSEKAQDILIEALAETRNRGVQFELTIIGAGQLHEQLIKLCESLKMDGCIRFMGVQSQNSVIEMLQDSDVFVLSSRSEGLPVVCMEAMAIGAFMIATRIKGIPELVQDKVNGLLVEPDDVKGLSDAICWVDQNRDRIKNMCALAREKVELEFDRKKSTELLIKNAGIAINYNR
jgi:colanic acid/amylovoran biosynthesis glycosyltransferase